MSNSIFKFVQINMKHLLDELKFWMKHHNNILPVFGNSECEERADEEKSSITRRACS